MGETAKLTSAPEIEQASMEGNLKTWQEELKLADDIENRADDDSSAEDEVDMDGLRFTDNKITAADWETFHKMCPGAIALSLTECDLETIEMPEKDLELKVLDISRNKLTNFDFLKKCPHLVSLVVSGNEATLEKLAPLKDLPEFRLLEAMNSSDEPEMVFDEELMGFEDADTLRAKVFETFPNLDKFNSKDKNGDMEEEDLLEIMARHYAHCGSDEELDSDEDDLDDEDDEKDEEKENDDDEPPAKKAKTDEKEEA